MKVRKKFHVTAFHGYCVSMAALVSLADEELNELIREAINEIRLFRFMYAMIWIPLFTLLLVLSYVNYRLYRRQITEDSTKTSGDVQPVYLRKELYDAVAKIGEVDAYVNKIVEESLKEKRQEG